MNDSVISLCLTAAMVLLAGCAFLPGDNPSSPPEGAAPDTAAPAQRTSQPAAPSGSGTYLTLYREQSQGAFQMLVPKGWQADGGMIGSGLNWNVVDLVESNIRFRVTSPDGRSFFGYYPRFYFQDPAVTARSSMGMLQPQPGQVQSGCWLYPYLSIRQYLEVIVFGQLAAQEIQNPRFVGDVVPVPALKALVPSVASHYQAGYADFVCTVRGVPSYGRIYTVLYNLQDMIWSTVFTAGWLAPQSRWREDGRIMEICLKTFQLDPQWAARAAAAAAQRSKQYGDTLRYLNDVDRQITENRSQTRSGIQEEFYKAITGQIETRDPQTGQETWLPAYRFAFTDGRGNYFLSDDPNQNPTRANPEWRALDLINRNDPDYRPNR
mgnify:CR=1 FL=1